MDIFPLIMCRVCERKINLIDISVASNQRYLDMYLACANVTFHCSDRLPKHLCRLCALKLVHFYEFKQNCENTQKKLEQQLSTIIDENIVYPWSSTNDVDVSLTEEYFDESNDETELSCSETAPKEPPKLVRQVIFKCDICRKTFKRKFRLEYHLMAKHNMARNHRQCEDCEEWFSNDHKFVQHIAKHKQPYVCELCSKPFSMEINLTRHVRDVHERLKPFACTTCGTAFAQKSALKGHISQVHLSEYNFVCTVCNKAFKGIAGLKYHELSHLPATERKEILETGRKIKIQKRGKPNQTYVCEYCGKTYTNYPAHYVHVKTHVIELFECDVCGKQLKSKTALYMHRRIHNERQFKCDVCGLAFHTSAKLKYHKIVHTGEKPFKCEYCGKEFAQKGGCITHTRLHTGEKPFKCEECNDCFIDLNGLKRHRKKNHDS